MTEVKDLNIYQKIKCIMSEVDYIQKGNKTVNGQYRFVSHDQVTSKIHPLLVKYGVLVIPSVQNITQDNNRTSVMLQVVFVNADDPKDNFLVQFPGYGVDSGDKGPGKAISYAFKYAILKTLCLETGDDPDNDANALYEPEKCLEFDLEMARAAEKDKSIEKMGDKIDKFLRHSSEATGKHVEDLKREAIKKLPEFIEALKKWSKKDKS